MFAALGYPCVRVVQRVHQPEDKAIEGLDFRETELFDDLNVSTGQCPGGFADLFQGKFEMGNSARLDADELAADEINGQAIATGYQDPEISLITVERAFAILP